MVLAEVEAFIFPGGLWGSNIIFVIGIIIFFAFLLMYLRVPMWTLLIIIAPMVLIGGGNLLSLLIPSWIKVLLVVGIFALLGIAYVYFTSSNK